MTRFITLVIILLMAFIPANIADKKGYSKGGFYCYGFFMFLPALIHSLLIPDQLDTTKKQYKGKTLGFSITAVICLWVLYMYSIYNLILTGRFFRTNVLSDVDYLIYYIASLIMPVLMIVSVMLARKFKYSIVVYALEAAYAIRALTHVVMYLTDPERGTPSADTYGYLVRDVLTVVIYVMLIFFAFNYGVKAKKLVTGGAFLFLVPGLATLISHVISLVLSYQYYNIIDWVTAVIQMLLSFIAFLFLGLFYKEEAKHNGEALAEEVSA